MKIYWDEDKNLINQREHYGLSFETAQRVYLDGDALIFRTPEHDHYEERWASLGMVESTVLYVAHTYEVINHDEYIKIISARKADKAEVRRYLRRS